MHAAGQHAGAAPALRSTLTSIFAFEAPSVLSITVTGRPFFLSSSACVLNSTETRSETFLEESKLLSGLLRSAQWRRKETSSWRSSGELRSMPPRPPAESAEILFTSLRGEE